MENSFLNIIIFITSISTILLILEALGFLPDKISRWLIRNKLSTSLEVLKAFGIDTNKYKRHIISSDIPAFINHSDLEKNLRECLKEITIKEGVNVGKTETIHSNYFIDLIGTSANSEAAELYARYLATYWKRIIIDNSIVQNPSFDFVVTPKLGSPLLGYKFSKLFNKPFVLHLIESKFQSQTDNPKKIFDFGKSIPNSATTALLVDDSATGGRKIIKAIEDLRKYGYMVTDCLVVFEPTIKNVHERLKDRGVTLHSIIKIGEDFIEG